jgi:hypothetical protein
MEKTIQIKELPKPSDVNELTQASMNTLKRELRSPCKRARQGLEGIGRGDYSAIRSCEKFLPILADARAFQQTLVERKIYTRPVTALRCLPGNESSTDLVTSAVENVARRVSQILENLKMTCSVLLHRGDEELADEELNKRLSAPVVPTMNATLADTITTAVDDLLQLMSVLERHISNLSNSEGGQGDRCGEDGDPREDQEKSPRKRRHIDTSDGTLISGGIDSRLMQEEGAGGESQRHLQFNARVVSLGQHSVQHQTGDAPAIGVRHRLRFVFPEDSAIYRARLASAELAEDPIEDIAEDQERLMVSIQNAEIDEIEEVECDREERPVGAQRSSFAQNVPLVDLTGGDDLDDLLLRAANTETIISRATPVVQQISTVPSIAAPAVVSPITAPAAVASITSAKAMIGMSVDAVNQLDIANVSESALVGFLPFAVAGLLLPQQLTNWCTRLERDNVRLELYNPTLVKDKTMQLWPWQSLILDPRAVVQIKNDEIRRAWGELASLDLVIQAQDRARQTNSRVSPFWYESLFDVPAVVDTNPPSHLRPYVARIFEGEFARFLGAFTTHNHPLLSDLTCKWLSETHTNVVTYPTTYSSGLNLPSARPGGYKNRGQGAQQVVILGSRGTLDAMMSAPSSSASALSNRIIASRPTVEAASSIQRSNATPSSSSSSQGRRPSMLERAVASTPRIENFFQKRT